MQSGDDPNTLVASYDLSVGRPQRFLVGLVINDQHLVSFGEAELSFSFLGKGQVSGDPVPGPTAEGIWQPIPGDPAQRFDSVASEAELAAAVEDVLG